MKPLVSQVFPSDLFWGPERSDPERDSRTSPATSLDTEWESVSAQPGTASPVMQPVIDKSVPDRAWPVIQPPQKTLCEASITGYSSLEDSIPMAFISISNVALQYILLFRDFILSVDERFIGGEVKFGAVLILSATTAVGYTLLTLEEASIRSLIFVISAIILLPFAVIGLLFTVITHSESILKGVIRIEVALFLMMGSSLQNIAQIATGIIAAHHMMTDTSPNLPEVNVLVGEATFKLNHFAEKTARYALSLIPKTLI